MVLRGKARSNLPRIASAIVFIATAAYCTGALAQNVYKCGNTYSEIPCPDGQRIESKDPRTAQQTKQAQMATEKNWAQIQALEKTREVEGLAAQAHVRTSAKPKAKASTPSLGKTQAATPKAGKKKTPEYFTASAEKPSKGAKP